MSTVFSLIQHSLQYIYDAIREDLSYIQESNNSNEVTAILNDLIKFIAIRIKLIDLYPFFYMHIFNFTLSILQM